MKERPMLFSAPMVRAILDGSKTQTRRICKNEAYGNGFHFDGHDILCHSDYLPPGAMLMDVRRGKHGYTTSNIEGWESECPYGQVGDRIWVRETCAIEFAVEHDQEPPHKDGRPIKWSDDPEEHRWMQAHYRATDPAPELHYVDSDEPACRWRPSIHMPRWASRINLEITGVRVERLQDISEADAKSEGAPDYEEGVDAPPPDGEHEWAYRASFQRLWESINGAGSWDANPWVWVVEFRRLASKE